MTAPVRLTPRLLALGLVRRLAEVAGLEIFALDVLRALDGLAIATDTLASQLPVADSQVPRIRALAEKLRNGAGEVQAARGALRTRAFLAFWLLATIGLLGGTQLFTPPSPLATPLNVMFWAATSGMLMLLAVTLLAGVSRIRTRRRCRRLAARIVADGTAADVAEWAQAAGAIAAAVRRRAAWFADIEIRRRGGWPYLRLRRPLCWWDTLPDDITDIVGRIADAVPAPPARNP
ncbi:hypothetical protein [Longispora albida]|uniref:hypothetical protein n=1 Tax=Longispora albida TaxID=203523 RepID=UPI000370E56F|nr:hypothetical protein [Longispora albida]